MEDDVTTKREYQRIGYQPNAQSTSTKLNENGQRTLFWTAVPLASSQRHGACKRRAHKRRNVQFCLSPWLKLGVDDTALFDIANQQSIYYVQALCDDLGRHVYHNNPHSSLVVSRNPSSRCVGAHLDPTFR